MHQCIPVFVLQEPIMKNIIQTSYKRYHIKTSPAPDIEKWPSRFTVKVDKIKLATYLIKEVLEHGLKKKEVILSRPCLYGVFSGPIGGFAPRPQHCVGCLRCTTENPDMISVQHNPERKALGDSFFTSEYINAISYESQEGMIPVKGAGYRGKFGGDGWDGMWTDMSEIVRPTRDGIHGREFISTVVDIGYRPNYLVFDENFKPVGNTPQIVTIPLPLLFDTPPPSTNHNLLAQITAGSAQQVESFAILPIETIISEDIQSASIIPLVNSKNYKLLDNLSPPILVEMDGWDNQVFEYLHANYPNAIAILRIPFSSGNDLLRYLEKDIHTFHLTANFHGKGEKNMFVLDLIRDSHNTLVNAGIRQETTLIGSGGIIAAEHIPKAILCGLDAVALDTPIMVAIQAKFDGECKDRKTSNFILPNKLSPDWGMKRILNMTAAWRDQLLEISGAMGLREIRRMRGEMGRAMFMKTLEADAFAGVVGYE
jgi:hypothetical protein